MDGAASVNICCSYFLSEGLTAVYCKKREADVCLVKIGSARCGTEDSEAIKVNNDRQYFER